VNTIAIGVDLVEITRIQKMLDRHADRALRRLLSSAERDYCMSKARPAQHVAARVAAKEAAYKALQVDANAGAVSWLDIDVRVASNGRPSLTLVGLAQAAASRLGVKESLVSISHSIDTAVAFVVLLG
jgi:holo-[acyl-carrier protein] synthase